MALVFLIDVRHKKICAVIKTVYKKLELNWFWRFIDESYCLQRLNRRQRKGQPKLPLFSLSIKIRDSLCSLLTSILSAYLSVHFPNPLGSSISISILNKHPVHQSAPFPQEVSFCVILTNNNNPSYYYHFILKCVPSQHPVVCPFSHPEKVLRSCLNLQTAVPLYKMNNRDFSNKIDNKNNIFKGVKKNKN